MQRIFYIVVLLTIIGFSCRSYKPIDPLSLSKSSTKWQQDFNVFQDILEKTHPSLYSNMDKKRASFLFDSLYSTLSSSTTLREFHNSLNFFTNEIGCTHTNVFLPSHIIDTLYNRTLFFPLPIILIGDKLIVNSDHELSHGTEILSIEGRTPQRILNSLSIYNSVDGKHRKTQHYEACFDFGLQYFIKYGGKKDFNVVVKDTLGKKQELTLSAISLEALKDRESEVYYYDPSDVPYSLRVDDMDKHAVLTIRTFDFESINSQNCFEDFLKNSFELLKTKPIIDLRNNNGGLLYFCFLLFSYLYDKEFREYKTVNSKIGRVPFPAHISENFRNDRIVNLNEKLKEEFELSNNGGFFLKDSLIEKWMPNKHRFSGNIFVITNSRVASTASYFTYLIKNANRGKVVGIETSGGAGASNGFESLEYKLPNSEEKLVFAYARLNYFSSDSVTGKGVSPDYIISDSMDSFRDNKDEQIRFIIDSLILKYK
jgi:C-terminal processing protease CtpA/Prc